jgi:outer membrane protein insertion porin family
MGESGRTRGRALMRGGLRAAALGLAAGAVIAGLAEAQAFRFTSFDVQGNRRIDANSIVAQLGIAPGETVSAAQLNDGFQRLQASGLFERVEIVPQGNRLLVIVEEYPTVNRISIEGNERIDDETILELVGSQARRVFDPAQAERDAAAIADAYLEQGRLSATVTPQLIRRSDNRVDLVFEVAEGRVTEIERLSFTGNRAYSDRRLRRVLETTQAGLFRAVIGSDTLVAERIPLDVQLLSDFYLSRGYVDFQVLSVTPQLAPTRDAVFLTFQVREGQQFRFGRVTASSTVAGIEMGRYLREVRVEPGRVYSPQAIERTVTRLENLALQQGLSFVRATPRITRNDRAGTVDVNFVLERGERIFVERIDIEGNATTLDRVIRREFETVEGDPFNPRAIRQAAERIRALGYFAEAEVETREGSGPDRVIVDVDVEEQPTGSLGFGLNYSVQSGPGIALSFSEANFLGRGQTLRFTLDTSRDDQQVALSFSEPYLLGRDLRGSLAIFYDEVERDNQSFDTRAIGFRPSLNFPVSEYGRLGVFYSLEEDTLEDRDQDDELSAILEADEGSFITSSVGYDYSWSTIGRGLDPTRGVRLGFGQEFAGVGGDTEFILTTFEVAGERAVRNEELTLRAVLEGGALYSLGDDPSRQANRFFNRQSVIRGFESGGIGPRDLNAEDDPLGGNYFVAARFEALFPVALLPEEYGISGAAFLDAGSVWGLDDENGGVDGTQPVDDGFFLNSAVGIGILWDTQIGPLRFNFTQPVNQRDYDKEQNFDLTIQTRF